jgi:hypothetical protein
VRRALGRSRQARPQPVPRCRGCGVRQCLPQAARVPALALAPTWSLASASASALALASTSALALALALASASARAPARCPQQGDPRAWCCGRVAASGAGLQAPMVRISSRSSGLNHRIESADSVRDRRAFGPGACNISNERQIDVEPRRTFYRSETFWSLVSTRCGQGRITAVFEWVKCALIAGRNHFSSVPGGPAHWEYDGNGTRCQ